jgi:hypothetical protein
MNVRFNQKQKAERPTYYVTPSMNLTNIQDLSDILGMGVSKNNNDNSLSNLSSFMTNRAFAGQQKLSRSSVFNKFDKTLEKEYH